MRKALPVLAAVVLLAAAGCGSFEPPPNAPAMQLRYPSGVSGDLPHLNPGDTIPIAALVTDFKGNPVAGVEVIWDDGRWPVGAQPSHVLSDSRGRAAATWNIRPLTGGAFSEARSIRAYLPGARFSPLEYRALVVECTRCTGGS
jgi:hypothetical protein